MHSFVSVCVSWLESRASLRWAAADILVCFNPLANKTAGNHQKNPPAGQGGEHGVGEERSKEKRRGSVGAGLDKKRVETRNERKKGEEGGWIGHMDVGGN